MDATIQIATECYLEYAQSLEKKELYHEAHHFFKKAAEFESSSIDIQHSYAFSSIGIGLVDEALKTLYSMLKQYPTNTQILYTIGYTLKMAGRVDEAINYYTRILSIDPYYEPASFALGHALLFKGDFAAGWKQHEQYLKKSHKNSEILRQFIKLNTLKHKKILLHFEGGLGDTLQFIRYALPLKQMGAIVYAKVQKPLKPLLSLCPYIDKIYTDYDQLPYVDDVAWIMSLPAIFNSCQETIPKTVPYLFADETLIHKWKNYLPAECTLKIGLCWQADTHHDLSRLPVARRGIALEQFSALGCDPRISCYSLQQKEGLQQLKSLPNSFKIHVFEESFDQEHGAFMDTAAVMKNLDLVITVDTSIAHLAGALGTPVWLLLPYATDWRWIAHRTDSPWYPSMKIFKQSKPFDWSSVMADVQNQLKLMFTAKNKS